VGHRQRGPLVAGSHRAPGQAAGEEEGDAAGCQDGATTGGSARGHPQGRVVHVHASFPTSTAPRLREKSCTITTYSSGMKRIARKVPLSIPPRTLVPMADWAPAPAPVAIASGSTPKPNAIEVIT